MITINPVLLLQMLQWQEETNCLNIGKDWIKQPSPWVSAIFIECSAGMKQAGWNFSKPVYISSPETLNTVTKIWSLVISLLMQEINGEFEDCVNLVIDEIQEPLREPPANQHEAFERVAATAIICGSAPIRCFIQLLHSLEISFSQLYDLHKAESSKVLL